MKNAEMLADVLDRVTDCAEGCAKATGTTVTREVITATHDFIPNLRINQLLEKNLREVGVPKYTEEDQKAAKAIQKTMGVKETGYTGEILETVVGSQPVTDSSEYSWFAPVAFLNVAISPSEDSGWHAWTSAKFAGSAVGKEALDVVGKALASTAYDLLTNPEILDEAQAELKDRLGGKTYESLIPAESRPDLDLSLIHI